MADQEPDFGVQLAEGYKIINFGTQSTFIGHVDDDGKPSGHGFMIFSPPPGEKGYDMHEGEFVAGRAHGPGVFLGHRGEQMEGSWQENKRVGMFSSIKPTGVKYKEKYDETGKMKARKKLTEQPIEPPSKCWNCGGLYRETYNCPYACRKHRGEWRPKDRFNEEGEGVWSCCVNQTYTHPGCEFTTHNLNH